MINKQCLIYPQVVNECDILRKVVAKAKSEVSSVKHSRYRFELSQVEPSQEPVDVDI